MSAALQAAPFGRGPEGALQWANLHFSSRLAAPELAGGAQLRRPGALQENASSVKTNQQLREALFFQPAQPEAHAPRCLEPHTSLDRLPAPGWGGGSRAAGGCATSCVAVRVWHLSAGAVAMVLSHCFAGGVLSRLEELHLRGMGEDVHG